MEPKLRARPDWTFGRVAVDASREAIRPSLNRFYAARTDPTRTRQARREAKAMRQARMLKLAVAR